MNITMIYQANELLAKLRYLTLAGQNADKELEWIGTDRQWADAHLEEECILRDHDEWVMNHFI